MKTWFQLWPILLLPMLLVFVPALLPHIAVPRGFSPDGTAPMLALGGDLYRQWSVNTFLLPLLPGEWAHALVAWYQRAGVGQELALHALISVNINAALLPLLYLLGELRIRATSWVQVGDLEAKRKLARQQRR